MIFTAIYGILTAVLLGILILCVVAAYYGYKTEKKRITAEIIRNCERLKKDKQKKRDKLFEWYAMQK